MEVASRRSISGLDGLNVSSSRAASIACSSRTTNLDLDSMIPDARSWGGGRHTAVSFFSMPIVVPHELAIVLVTGRMPVGSPLAVCSGETGVPEGVL